MSNRNNENNKNNKNNRNNKFNVKNNVKNKKNNIINLNSVHSVPSVHNAKNLSSELYTNKLSSANVKLVEKCQEVDYTFNLANLAVQRDPSTLNENLMKIRDSIFDLVAFYNSYKLRLTDVDEAYNKVIKAWDSFASLLVRYQDKTLNNEMQIKLGNALQKVKDANLNLMNRANW